MSTLAGKRALVTGGSAGVGAAVARLLAQNGARVAINYSSNAQRAEETSRSLHGNGHISIQGDALSKNGIKTIVEKVIKSFGGLDIVVSNVGWTTFGNFNDLNSVSTEGWERCYQTNVLSHLWLMQETEATLRANEGSFTVSASVAGLIPSGSSMAYSVSKAATIHLVKSLAKACAPRIRVNCIAAGVMLTDWSQGFTEEQIAEVEERNALGRVTSVDDVAAMYVSVIQNRSMTGQHVEVSSGFRL